MSGFVDLLAGALATFFLVFIVMLLSFLKALLMPTEGAYKLATESGLVFPVESYILTDEIFNDMVTTFKQLNGEQSIYIGASCVTGKTLDTPTSERYTTYNIVFAKEKSIANDGNFNIAQVEYTPIIKNKNQLSNMCFITMKTKEQYKELIKAQKESVKGKENI